MASVAQLLAILGAGFALKAIYNVASLILIYLKPPAYHRYLHGPTSYALITGASDGIGKAVAKELYAKGFSLIIHGRNEEKLRNVQAEIKGAGTRDVRIWVADATAAHHDFETAVAQWKDLNITLVVNNVGGSRIRTERIDQVSEDELMTVVHRNAMFPFGLTRALLPLLRKAAGPVEILYIGSAAGDLPLPCLIPYGATKAFVKQFSICLNQDERFRTPSNISSMYLTVGSVVSNSHKIKPSLFSPTSEVFGKSIVARIGCGQRVVHPYFFHALQAAFTSSIPRSILETMILHSMEAEIAAAKDD